MGGHPSGITTEIEDLKLHERRTSDGTTPINIDTIKVPTDEVWKVNRVVAENETGSRTSIRFGTVRESKIHFLQEQQSPSLDTLYWTDEKFWVTSGEAVRVRFVGTVAADILNVWIWGVKKRKVYS